MSKSATITIINETKAKIDGLDSYDLTQLYNKYAIFAKNYFFSPKYKLKQWDGKINFFTSQGHVSALLLEDIVPFLVQHQYSLEVVDNRIPPKKWPKPIDKDVFNHILHAKTKKPTELRYYQVDAVNSLIEGSNGILLASTGAGKTLITAAMAYSFNEVDMRTLIIVPDESLARQTAEEMLHYELDTGLYIGKVKDTEHTNIVATWQSLKNLPAYIKEFDCVIVDETHGARGPILKNLLIEYATNVPFRYGLTGTLPEDPCDKMQVHSALGPIRYEIPAHKLIDEGILATINIDVIELTEDFTDEYKQFVELELNGDSSIISYSEFVDEYFADYDAERSFLRKSPLRNEWISNLIIDCQDQPKGNVLVITDSVALTRILGDLIPGSYVVNGQDVAKAADRKVIYKEFDTRNDVVMIATSKLCSTGIDIPRIHYVIMIDLGKSFIKIIQTIGRGARKADDKDSIKAIDISSNLKYAKKHVKERIKHYKNAKYPFKKFSIDYVKQIKMEDNDNVII